MSRATLKSIHKLFMRNQLDFGMFCWISAIKKTLPSVTIRSCIEQYQDYFSFDDIEMDSEVAATTYDRMKKEFEKYKSDDKV